MFNPYILCVLGVGWICLGGVEEHVHAGAAAAEQVIELVDDGFFRAVKHAVRYGERGMLDWAKEQD